MAGTHAPFAPSSLARLMQCAGSYELARHYPEDEEGQAAREGTAAHWVAERLLRDGEVIAEGDTAPNGVTVTQEMVEGAALYVRTVRAAVPVGGLVEQRIRTGLHDDCWGTADFVGINADCVLHVIDYKFGHRFVSEFENWQLIAYAWGTVSNVFMSGDDDTELHLTIVQPRCYDGGGSVRTWRTTVGELAAYARRASERLAAISSGELRDCTTGAACYMCPARRGCRALHDVGGLACDLVGQPEPLDLPPDALGVEMAYLEQVYELLKYRLEGLREQGLATINGGTEVPGWHVTSKPGREKWRAGVPVAEIAAIGKMWGVELTRTEPITPTQARKKLSDASMLDALTDRPVSTSLQQDDMAKVARIFGA